MIFDGRWKYIHVENMRPMFFDLQTDASELHDLGDDPDYLEQVERLSALHFKWTRQHHSRITRSAASVEAMTDQKEPPGIIIGFGNAEELKAAGLTLPSHTTR